MKEVLSAKSLEEAEKDEAYTGLEEDADDEIRKSMLARGKQNNLSFFVFTGKYPKPKTVEVFGTMGKKWQARNRFTSVFNETSHLKKDSF